MFSRVKQIVPHVLWTLLVVVSFYVWMMPSLEAPAPITDDKHDPDSYYHLYSRDIIQQFHDYGYVLWWGHPGLPLQVANCSVHWAKYIFSTGSLSNAGYTQYWHTRLTESWQLTRFSMYLASLLILYLVYYLARCLEASQFTASIAMLLTLGHLSAISYLPQIHPDLYFWTAVCPDSFAMLFLFSSFIALYYAVDKLHLSGRNAFISLILASFFVVSAIFTKIHTMGILLPISLVHILFNNEEIKTRLKAAKIFCIASSLFSIPYIAIMNRETFISGWGIYAKQAATMYELPEVFWSGFITIWGVWLTVCLGGLVVLVAQKRYNEPVVRSLLLYTFFIMVINVIFVSLGLPRIHYLLPIIPIIGYMGAHFVTFVLEKTFRRFSNFLPLSKIITFVAILFLVTIPEFAKEASFEHKLVVEYRQLKVDEIFDKASELGNEEYMLFPEDHDYSPYFFALRLTPIMNKIMSPGIDKNEPFSMSEVKEIMAEKRIKYIVAPSLGEQIIYAPDKWVELMNAENKHQEAKEKSIDG
jgi:hypothetical protein